MGGVAALDRRAERPALHRLGQDHRGGAPVLRRGLVGGVDLLVVVPASGQGPELVVAQVLDQLAQAGVGPEEVLADVGARLDRVALPLAVEGGVHLGQQDAVDVAGEQVVPALAPDQLDDVPAGATEDALELLDDLAVAAHRAVEALEVAVHDPHEVVELLAAGERDRAEGLGLVGLAVAEEAPHLGVAGVVDAAVVEVAAEAGLVDRVERAEAHRHRGELPEVGHQPRVRVAREATAADLATEVVEVALVEAALEERTGVDAWRGVALEVDVVAGEAVVLAPEEVVEADLVEHRRRGERREVAADAVGLLVGVDDHHGRVPAHEAPDALLHRLVTREPGLLLAGDGVDVGRLHLGRRADLELTGPLGEAGHEVPRPHLPAGVDHCVERVEPLRRLARVGVRDLADELVDARHRVPLASACRVCVVVSVRGPRRP